MAIYLIGKIKQKNNGTFSLMDTTDIEHSDGQRLDAILEELRSGQAMAIKIDDTNTSKSSVWSSKQVDDAILAAKQALKDELLDGAAAEMDTFKELAQAIKGNQEVIDVLRAAGAKHISFESQTLTEEQKAQARANIDGASVADVAEKIDGTKAQSGQVNVDTLMNEGFFFVANPAGLPSGFTATNVFVMVLRSGDQVTQEITGTSGGRVQKHVRTGVASGDSVTWAAFNEVGAPTDISNLATKQEVGAAKSAAEGAQTTANEAKTTAETNKTALDALGALAHKDKISPEDLEDVFDLGSLD